MKNLTLILDFSAALSVGVVDDTGRLLAHRIREQGTRGETAHALLEECLSEAGGGVGDIAEIGVGVGPGSFTGIRVCAAMAQGLAFAERLPLYPFSSLAGIVTGASDPDPTGSTVPSLHRVSAIAANGGRYFVRWARDSAAGAVRAEYQEALLTADALLALGTPYTHLYTAGQFPDRDRMRPAFAALSRHEDVADFPALARLARSLPAVLDGVLRPNYLQASAAEEKRRAGELPR